MKLVRELLILPLIFLLVQSGFAQQQNTIIQGVYNNTTIVPVKVASDGSLILSGTITGGNAAAGTTGATVPGSASYTGGNVAGNLVGITGTVVTTHTGLDVNIIGGAGSGGTASNFGSAIPTAGTASGQSDGTNMQLPRVFDDDSGAGTQYVTGVSLRLAGSGGSVEAGTASNPLRIDPTGSTAQPVTDNGGSLTVDQATGSNLHTVVDSGAITVTGAAASGASKSGNPVQTGGVFNTTQPTVTTGQSVENQNTARGAQIVATGVDTFNTTINSALPAGTNVIGHVIMDATSTTIATQATAANLNATIVGTKTNNNAAPGATNLGVLPCIANASTPSWTEGDAVNCSVTLGGQERIIAPAITYNSTQPTLTNGQTEVDYQIGSRGGLIVATGSDPFLVSLTPSATSGLTPFVLEPVASDNHTVVKNGATQVGYITVFNNSATLNYLRLYNLGTGFNGCGSATGLVWEGNIPASTSGAGFVEDIGQGIALSTGLSICVTSGYGSTNTTSATASAMSVNIGYK